MGVGVVTNVTVRFGDASWWDEHLVDNVYYSVGGQYVRISDTGVIHHDDAVSYGEGDVVPVESLCCHSVGDIRGCHLIKYDVVEKDVAQSRILLICVVHREVGDSRRCECIIRRGEHCVGALLLQGGHQARVG